MRVFGENRVQEALGKWPELKSRYSDVELHLIGPLQSNKARDAVGLFDCIHTIDRPKIASAIAAEMERQGRKLKLLVQVNTGEEDQKSGVPPGEVDAFLARCRKEFGLEIEGLMCIPPLNEEPSLHFALLNKIAARNRDIQSVPNLVRWPPAAFSNHECLARCILALAYSRRAPDG